MAEKKKKAFSLRELVKKAKAKKVLPKAVKPIAVPEKKKAVKKEEEIKAIKEELKAKAEAEKAPPVLPEEKPPKIIPAPTRLEKEIPTVKELEKAKKIKVTSYGNTTIYRIPGRGLLHYEVPVPRPTVSEKTVINTIKEAATRLITISPYRIRDPEQRRTVYFNQIMDILRTSEELNIPRGRYEFYANVVVREMVGYGLVDDLIKDDKLEEIMIIGPGKPVYVFHRDYEMMTTNIEFLNDTEIQDLINRIARGVGRRVDISSPLLDARLPDGSRVNATIAPASVSGSTLTIRKFREDPYSIIDLINLETLNMETAAFLWLAVEGMGVKPANILIAGGTGSGKTTLLNVLASFISRAERIITIEDTAELNLPLDHWVRLEAKPPGLEEKGELTMDILTKNALRMRPDRIIVGEVRHAEAFTLFTALNTGHDGALSEDSLIQLSDGNLIEIGELAQEHFSKKDVFSDSGFEFVTVAEENVRVPSINKQTLKMEDKKITRIWRKKVKQKIKKITLRSGKTIKLTSDHPVYKVYNGIQETDCSNLKIGDFIAVPKEIEACSEKQLCQPYLAGLIYGDGHVGSGQIQLLRESPTKEIMKTIVESPMKFEKIVKVEDVDYDGYVYDLTVEDNHNYISNGIIVSNCMGTIHANSPEETIVRVLSPPMNVPELMLAGLDFIIIEHRLHDRRKGTIRRVTQIAEVHGAIRGKAITKDIFVRDPSKDTLVRTKEPIKYFQDLEDLTGIKKKEIEKEWKARIKALKAIRDKKIRRIDEVAKLTADYILKKRKLRA